MTTVFTTSALAGTDDGNGDGNSNQRLVFKASASILSAAAGANQVRVSGLWGSTSATDTSAIDDLWVGRGAGSSSQNYNGNQVQLKTTGGATTFDASAAGTFTTDWATFGASETFDNTKDLVISLHFRSGATGSVSTAGVTGIDFYFDNGAASNASATTGGLPNGPFVGTDILITSIEMRVSGGVVGKIFQVNQSIKRASYW